jgi:FAD/FMN-containing dehydrogenase
MSPTELPTAVASVIKAHSITCISPSQPEFEVLRQGYVPTSNLPSHIIRPQTADNVAKLVSAFAEAAIPFTVRSGGHDLQSRSTANGVVQLDLRLLATVQIASDRQTARIGGGASLRDVLGALEPAGLTAPVGNYGSVGYVGWSTYGGYGPYIGKFGLGTDGIVGARVVLPDGSLIDADERLLKCLRGGGPSNWGVVVELEIKVHEVQQVRGCGSVVSLQTAELTVGRYKRACFFTIQQMLRAQ